jgi:RNA polymerase sigma factor (sigma-70 family)
MRRGPLGRGCTGIAANLLRHHWRNERRMLRAYARTGVDAVLDEVEGHGQRMDAAAGFRAVAGEIAGLRVRDREILLLHAWAELSDREIAQALGLPIGTVKSRLHRTRARLRNRIEGDGQSELNRPIVITPEEQR